VKPVDVGLGFAGGNLTELYKDDSLREAGVEA
jgi:hypothetical protein